MLNEIGPSADPCGTPNDVYKKVEMSVLACTKCFQPYK